MKKINDIIKISIKYSLMLLILVKLTGCIPDETPVTPHETGDMTETQVEMDKLYETQVYFNFALDSVVASNKITDWDIGFSCIADSFVVIMNNAKTMRAFNTHKTDFAAVSSADTAGFDDFSWEYDNPSGFLDSTAMGTWWSSKSLTKISSKEEVYIIDLGIDGRSRRQGMKKLKILKLENSTYSIEFAELDGIDIQTMEIPINPAKNFILVSLKKNTIPDLEPISANWDFCFTKYTEKLYTGEEDFFLWYGVTGPLLNRVHSSAVFMSADSVIGDVQFEEIKDSVFSTNINAIGHEWKWFDLNAGAYIVLPNRIFVIKTITGYYKFHFVSFYNETGDKGYPKFEFQKL